MRLGIALPQGGGQGSRTAIARVAREAERLGLDSLWVLDRLLRPRRPVAVLPGDAARPLPEFYANVFDPLETLAFAAALTERIALGTSVINALLHPPVVLAKRLATLDQLSGGRVIAGLGQGWLPEEFAVAGVPPGRRGSGMVEYVAALRAAWGPDPVRFAGRFYRIPESDIGPKPAQGGAIPILIGCYAPAAIDRAARFADGLNPLATTWVGLEADITRFRAAAQAAGRDPVTLQVVVRANAQLTEAPLPADRPPFAGTTGQWIEDTARAAALGVGHLFLAIEGDHERALAAMGQLRQHFPPG